MTDPAKILSFLNLTLEQKLTDQQKKLLNPYRQKIDALDEKIVALLIERLNVIQQVGHLKLQYEIPAVLQDRVDEVIDRAGNQAKDQSQFEDEIREIYTFLVTLCCAMEEKILSNQEETL